MYQCVGHLASLDVPDTHSGVAGTADDDFVVVLQTEHGSGVPSENLERKPRLGF